MSYNKLKGRIVEICGTQNVFCEKMGWNTARLSTRMHGVAKWTQPDIIKACEVLHIPKEEIHIYFFNRLVKKN